MSHLVTISDGSQFFRVPRSELENARRRGFYLPADQGRTIVSDGKQILEIALTDLAAAAHDGFRDLIGTERGDASGPVADEPSVYRQAELEQEAHHEALQKSVEEASVVGKLPAFVRLCWFEYRETVFRQLRTNGLSIAIHVALLLLLSAVWIVDRKVKNPSIITVTNSDESPIEEVVIETVDFEIEEPVEETVEEPAESQEVVNEVTEQLVSVNIADTIDAGLLAAPESGSSGDGEDMKPTKAKVKFFGAKTEAVDFVFVIDNSNSMTRGRFETALNELVKAVNNLNRRQKFYVIFYSDTAYPLFHPQPPRTLVPATSKNKYLLANWLQTVPLCLKTNGREALELGLSLKPDVMFVLGDGAFTDWASRYYTKNPVKGVVLHTLGMEVNTKNAMSFKSLAEAHQGTYQDVGVHPQAAILAKQFPRKRNNTRNGIWGLKLPEQRKK
ncbi:MAG: vWA domain-containing protein [Planctomycetota bacterium]